MPIEWPGLVPFDQVREGAQISSISRQQRNTEFETGPPQSVRVDIVSLSEMSCSFVWEPEEYAAWLTWFKTALGMGTAWFNMPVPTRRGAPGAATKNVYEVRYCKIVDQAVQVEDVSSTHVRVSFKLLVEDL